MTTDPPLVERRDVAVFWVQETVWDRAGEVALLEADDLVEVALEAEPEPGDLVVVERPGGAYDFVRYGAGIRREQVVGVAIVRIHGVGRLGRSALG
jgi:hypothetical protein